MLKHLGYFLVGSCIIGLLSGLTIGICLLYTYYTVFAIILLGGGVAWLLGYCLELISTS